MTAFLNRLGKKPWITIFKDVFRSTDVTWEDPDSHLSLWPSVATSIVPEWVSGFLRCSTLHFFRLHGEAPQYKVEASNLYNNGDYYFIILSVCWGKSHNSSKEEIKIYRDPSWAYKLRHWILYFAALYQPPLKKWMSKWRRFQWFRFVTNILGQFMNILT